MQLCRFQKDLFWPLVRELESTLKAIHFIHELAAMPCISHFYHFSYQTYIITDYRIGSFYLSFTLCTRQVADSWFQNICHFLWWVTIEVFFFFWDIIGDLTPSSTKEFLKIAFTFIYYGKLGWNLGEIIAFPLLIDTIKFKIFVFVLHNIVSICALHLPSPLPILYLLKNPVDVDYINQVFHGFCTETFVN